MAWWHGTEIVVERSGRPDAAANPRIRRAKTGMAGFVMRDTSGDRDKQPCKPAGASRNTPVAASRPLAPLYASTRQGGDEAAVLDFDYSGMMAKLWGAGLSFPGGINSALEALEPILRKANYGDSVLDFGAGGGGLIRHLKNFYGMKVTGYDPDPELSAASDGMVTMLNQVMPDFGESCFDFACSLNGLQDTAARAKVLKAAARALRPGGTMLLIDAVTTEPVSVLHTRQGARAAGFLVAVPSPRHYSSMLQDCRLAVQKTQNISVRYSHDVVRGWSNLTKEVRESRISKEAKALMTREAARWFAQVNALRMGKAKVMRMVLTKAG